MVTARVRSVADGKSKSAGLSHLRWKQVQLQLENDLGAGTYAPGTQVPTEQELAVRFGVHRHTVRRAIKQLCEKRLLRVEQGRGTFVPERDLTYRVGPKTRLTTAAELSDRRATWRVCSSAIVSADRVVAHALSLPLNHKVQRVEKLRVIDGRVLAATTAYYPLPRFAGIEKIIARTGSVTKAMAHFGVHEFPRKSMGVRAVMPTARDARMLQMSKTKPLLELSNLSLDKAGVPVQFVQSLHNAELIKLMFDF